MILIKSVELNGLTTDILIAGNRITRIAPQIEQPDATLIDGRRKVALPGFMNMHTHSAMTLFRGFGDDMPLMPWLEQKIWPNEAKLTYDDVYWGARLACLEMIRSGTTTFFDMYHKLDATAHAVEDTGLRAILSEACFDHFNPETAAKSKRNITERFKAASAYSERIGFALGPHAIYTVSGELLRWSIDFATDHGVLMQMHLAETETETQWSIEHTGLTPVRYLRSIGVLSPRLVVAHVLHVDDEEIRMLADNGVKVVHNPASNMKLASGYRFKFKEMREAGVTVALGTDGCASSNNLDMIEVMKLASLLGKVWRGDTEALGGEEMLRAATVAGAELTGLDVGVIAEGRPADIILIDLRRPELTPNHNFVSNLVFSANGSCVDTVICDGRLLMQGRKVENEDETMEHAAEAAYNLIRR
ncbi:MAG: amidohydrolase [Tannerella sp.]|nr:amidohydrolase [Tannerella sp.]